MRSLTRKLNAEKFMKKMDSEDSRAKRREEHQTWLAVFGMLAAWFCFLLAFVVPNNPYVGAGEILVFCSAACVTISFMLFRWQPWEMRRKIRRAVGYAVLSMLILSPLIALLYFVVDYLNSVTTL